MSAEAKSLGKVCPACNARYDEGGAFCSRDGTPLVKDPQAGQTSLVGQILADRYRVVRLIGEGGMGQVYEAQHVNINRRFALKLLRPEIVSNAEAVARFRQEAWSASSIGHDNIIEIEDFATLPSGAVYLAMEFLDGAPLSERMRQEPPLGFAESLDVMLQVASGLAAAHDKAIIHRDMKPENIFLGRKHGRALVKILDFGIAKVSGAEGNQSLTRTGTIFGTPHYMSPEQALGKPLDHRADIYSVGVIMYELFTGRVPFEAESFMGILTKHITTPPTPPRQAAPERDIPPEIEAVILRAMSKEADERYQSMADLATDLVAIAESRVPEVLMPRPAASQVLAQVSRPLSALMPANGASASAPMGVSRATPTPSGPRPLEVTPAPPPRPRARAPWIALGAIVLVGGAGAFAWRARTGATTAPPPAVVAPPPVQPVAAAPVTPPPQPTTPAAPPAPALEQVIIDSVPPGARIWVDGAPVGTTPDTISVEKGATKAVVLKKDGFVDQPETVDPAHGRKMLVRLERVKRARPAAKPAVKLPRPPSVALDPPSTAPKPSRPPATHPRPKHGPIDPYERVDDTPKKSGGDVLNPY